MIGFVLGNSVDPDEMPHSAAIHLGLTVYMYQSTHLKKESIFFMFFRLIFGDNSLF